jgi:hypothetical protein
MTRESWIPADLAPELAPVETEWSRRAAAVERARERVEALSPAARAADDRARREALAAAYAAGAEELPPEPLTDTEWAVERADAEEHLTAAERALRAYVPEAKAAIREHRNAIRSQFAERAAEARAEREAAEREAAEATERATAARREELHAERCSDWLEKAAAEGTYAEPRPSRFSVRRAGPRRPTLVDIANRGVVVPPPPEGLVTVGPDATPDEITAARRANGEATKRRIVAMEDAERAERAEREERNRRVLDTLQTGA